MGKLKVSPINPVFSTHSELTYFGLTKYDVVYKDIWSNQVTLGDNVVGWKDRMKAGLSVITTIDGTRGSVSSGLGIGSMSEPGAGYFVTFNGWAYEGVNRIPAAIDKTGLNTLAVDSTSAELATVNFAKSYRSRTRSWQSGVFAGEIFQAARLLTNPVRSLRDSALRLSSEVKRSTKAALKGRKLVRGAPVNLKVREAISNTYLEWFYGVQPTIRDCIDAGKAFRQMASGRTFDTVRIYGDSSDSSSSSSQGQFFPGGSPYVPYPKYAWDQSIVYRSTTKYAGGWKNENPRGEMPLPQVFGFDVLDVIPTTWELIPFSFLWDYFINVGDVLDAWQMRLVNFSWICRMDEQLLVQTNRPPPPSFYDPNGGYPRIYSTFASPFYVKNRIVKRTSGNNTFETGFQVKIPGISSQKWLNIAMLTAAGVKPKHLRI